MWSENPPCEAGAVAQASGGTAAGPPRRCPGRRRMHGAGTGHGWLGITTAQPAAECSAASARAAYWQRSGAAQSKVVLQTRIAYAESADSALVESTRSPLRDPYPEPAAETSPPACLPRRYREPTSDPDVVFMGIMPSTPPRGTWARSRGPCVCRSCSIVPFSTTSHAAARTRLPSPPQQSGVVGCCSSDRHCLFTTA